uniref:Uncharacterized protein n=1 Tax=Panagrolaimus superbus TaxID=310955 RepID=A0A914Y2E4_9BILA
MKLYFLIFLVILATLSTSSNTPKSDFQKEEEELLSDNIGVQNGSDVIMVKPGPLTIMLAENELVFEVCSSLCDSNFLVCYESDPVGQNVTEQCDSKCGFYVLTSGDKISFNEALTFATGLFLHF